MRILSLYLIRQLLANTVAVTLVLMLVFMSGRFIKYLAQAAAGGLSPDVLFSIMAYRIPGFLELILPLGLFISILLTLGRMYLDSEVSVMHACGISRSRILGMVMMLAFPVAILVGWLSLWMGPAGMQKVQDIFYEQSRLTEFEMLLPGRFQQLRSGTRVTYAGGLSEDKTRLSQVFIAELHAGARTPVIYVANEGHLKFDERSQSRYLVLDQGGSFRLEASSAAEPSLAFRAITFDAYGLLIEPPEARRLRQKDDALSSKELWQRGDAKSLALLQWRLSLAVLVPIVAVIALTLSRVNPRQGRFFQLLPAMLIYISYLALLIVARKWVEKGVVPVSVGLWWVHVMAFMIAMALFFREQWWKRKKTRSGKDGDESGGVHALD